jgi:ABC-type sugar transport system permease subunit
VAWFLERLRSDRTVAALFVVPSMVAIGIFVYGFIGWTGYVSLSRWRGPGSRLPLLSARDTGVFLCLEQVADTHLLGQDVPWEA